MTPGTVYRLFDADGHLLYVGCSTTPFARFTSHRSTKPFWVEVATIRMEHYETLSEARRAERAAIRRECPRHNTHDAIASERRERSMYPVPGLHCPSCGWEGAWIKKGFSVADAACLSCGGSLAVRTEKAAA